MRAGLALLSLVLMPAMALAQPAGPQSLEQKLRDPETADRIDR